MIIERVMKILKCKHCGKEFIKTQPARKFCSKTCAYLHSQQEYTQKHRGQPCWTCTKACGECSWSRNLTPVKGWVAEKVPFKTGLVDKSNDYTYKILECPEYEKG